MELVNIPAAGGPVYTIRQAAEYLGVEVRSIRNYVSRGVRGRKLGRIMVGGRAYFTPEHLAAFVEVKETTVETPAAENAEMSRTGRGRGKHKIDPATLVFLKARGLHVGDD